MSSCQSELLDQGTLGLPLAHTEVHGHEGTPLGSEERGAEAAAAAEVPREIVALAALRENVSSHAARNSDIPISQQ